MTTTIELIKKLREETNAGMMNCRSALEESRGDYTTALDLLREQAAVKAAQRVNKTASQGRIEIYSHGEGRIAVMVEICTETDFASRSQNFRDFAHEIALQIAAANPLYVDETEIPNGVLQEITERAERRGQNEGKPPKVIDTIVAGMIDKYKRSHVLLRQASIRDDSLTIGQMLANVSASVGEKIVIKRFIRWEIESPVVE